MHSRSFHILIAMLFGCNTEPTTDTASFTSDVPSAESNVSENISAQTVVITGHTTMVNGTSLSGAWVALADNNTQQVIAETTSDQNGAFTITLNDAIGDYTVLASYDDNSAILIAWQAFNLGAQQLNYQFELTLTEAPIIDDANEDDAVPPPGLLDPCYLAYFGSSWCENHTLYRYASMAGGWMCYLDRRTYKVAIGCC